MPIDLWISFFSAAFLLALAPGPDNLFVIVHSAMKGFRAGFFVTLGLCCGVLVHTTLATLGVASLVAASPTLLTVLKMIGALYLTYLAYGAWTAPVSRSDSTKSDKAPEGVAFISLWRRGLIMNLSNPKVLLFFLAFFPSFIKEGTTELEAFAQMLIMGATFLLVTLIVFTGFAWFAGRIADAIRTPRIQGFFNKLTAVIFLALAASTLLLSV